MLEALLKRVDGLEKRLHSEGKSDALPEQDSSSAIQHKSGESKTTNGTAPPTRPLLEIAPSSNGTSNQLMSPIEPR